MEPGRIRLRGVSRSFRLFHERNATLKETILRRRRAAFEERWVVEDVDLDIAPGEAVAIVGQNGSGKSTLLKVLAGIVPATAGTVEIGGTVASMLELGAGFHPDFTGRENVFMNASIHGLGERAVEERFDEILAFSELEDFIDMPVRTYSSGMSMRLAFAIAAHVNPDVLLLDEVLAVGDEAFQRKCFGRIADFRHGGGTLVFVSHDPTLVERVCGRAILLSEGRILADGPPATVLAAYHRLLADSGPSAPSPTSARPNDPADPRVWGNGQVAIVGARLVGSAGPTDRFTAGERMVIEMDILAGEPVATPTFGIAIQTSEGVTLYGTNTGLDAFTVEHIEGRAQIAFEIAALPLHEGRFTVTLAVHSQDESVIYHWLDRWLEFSVFQQDPGVGPVDLSGSWRLGAETTSPSPSASP